MHSFTTCIRAKNQVLAEKSFITDGSLYDCLDRKKWLYQMAALDWNQLKAEYIADEMRQWVDEPISNHRRAELEDRAEHDFESLYWEGPLSDRLLEIGANYYNYN